jgi:hypothetical protein
VRFGRSHGALGCLRAGPAAGGAIELKDVHPPACGHIGFVRLDHVGREQRCDCNAVAELHAVLNAFCNLTIERRASVQPRPST